MVNKQTPKSTITVNSVRLMPNLSAENPPIGVLLFCLFRKKRTKKAFFL